MKDILIFQYNALNNLIHLFQTNIFMLLMVASAIATAFLNMKEQVDMSVRDEQGIL